MEPKLFNYRLDTDESVSRYQFTTVELNQEHPILTDYNIGMRLDLVDREVYGVSQNVGRSKLLGADSESQIALRN